MFRVDRQDLRGIKYSIKKESHDKGIARRRVSMGPLWVKLSITQNNKLIIPLIYDTSELRREKMATKPPPPA
jgi:hypothetical protein